MDGAGLLVQRALAQRSLVVAVCLTVLFSVTVLAALGEYAAAETGEGVRATLAGASFDTAGTKVTTVVAAGGVPAADRRVRAAVTAAYRSVPAAVSLSARSDSYAAPGQEHSAHPQLTTFATYSGIERHARLVAGRWPAAVTSTAPAAVVEAALPEPAARAMGLSTGRTVTLYGRVGGPPVTVRVSGVFAVDRATDYVWGGDRLITTGSERLGYTTYGPLVVPPATFAARFTSTVTAQWLVLPSLGGVRAGDLAGLEARARALPKALGGDAADGTGYTVASALPGLLAQVGRAVLVARSTLFVPALQLLLLAVYTLMLVARLLAEHRQEEVALMRARGASGRQLATLAAGEAVLLSAPAAVAAPFLAGPLIHAVAATPVLAGNGPRPGAVPSGFVWAIAAGAALACAVAVAAPPLRGLGRPYVASVGARGRGALRGALQRAGADVLLVVVAGLAIWQLAHYGGPVTTTSSRRIGIDPLIVAGPALALLAGGVSLLRLVPVASRAGERITTRGRGFAAAVGTRQVSRRPLRTAGPALLLVMTVAVGVLSVATGATWRRSQLDQADFQAAADLRVTAPGGPSSPGPAGQGGRYRMLPGVTAVSPVLRDTGRAGNADVTVLAADAAVLRGMFRTRATAAAGAPLPRLAHGTEGPAGTNSAVGAGAAGGVALPIPGRPGRLAVGIRIGHTRQRVPVAVSVVLGDAFHVASEVRLGDVPADGRTHVQTVDVAALAGPGGVISYPVDLRAVRFSYLQVIPDTPATFTVTDVREVTGTRAGPPLRPPPSAHWAGRIGMTSGPAEPPRFGAGGLVTAALPMTHDQWAGIPTVAGTLVLRPAGGAGAGGATGATPIPALVTRELAARAHAGVGGRITVVDNGVEQPIVVAGVVPALPSAAPGTPGVLVDWAALGDGSLAAGVVPAPPAEWWLSARGGDTAPAVRALAAHPDWSRDTVVDRAALRHRLRDAPLGGALQGALVLGFAAALVFALIGFAVNTTVSARERAAEFAILRALGVGGRQVLGLIAVEQAFLVILGLAGGVLLGTAVAHLVVPYVVLTVRAAPPYPPAHVIIQWPGVSAMLGVIVVALAATLLLLVRALGRHGLGRATRAGEGR